MVYACVAVNFRLVRARFEHVRKWATQIIPNFHFVVNFTKCDWIVGTIPVRKLSLNEPTDNSLSHIKCIWRRLLLHDGKEKGIENEEDVHRQKEPVRIFFVTDATPFKPFAKGFVVL